MSLLKTTLAVSLGLALCLPLLADEAKNVTPTAKVEKSEKHEKHEKKEKKGKKVAKAEKSAKPNPATEAMMKKSDCFTCHSVAKKIVGPAYKDVAKKYRGKAGSVEMLVAKVKKGGSGHWGVIPMAAHPNLSDVQIKAMVEWVLAQK